MIFYLWHFQRSKYRNQINFDRPGNYSGTWHLLDRIFNFFTWRTGCQFDNKARCDFRTTEVCLNLGLICSVPHFFQRRYASWVLLVGYKDWEPSLGHIGAKSAVDKNESHIYRTVMCLKEDYGNYRIITLTQLIWLQLNILSQNSNKYHYILSHYLAKLWQ